MQFELGTQAPNPNVHVCDESGYTLYWQVRYGFAVNLSGPCNPCINGPFDSDTGPVVTVRVSRATGVGYVVESHAGTEVRWLTCTNDYDDACTLARVTAQAIAQAMRVYM